MGMSSSQNLQVARALARSNVDTQAIKASSESSPAPSSSAFLRDNTAAHPPLDFGLTKQADGYYHRSSIVVARVSSLHEPSLRLRRACSGSRQHILGFAEEMVLGSSLTILLAAGGIQALILRRCCARVDRLLYFSKRALASPERVRSVGCSPTAENLQFRRQSGSQDTPIRLPTNSPKKVSPVCHKLKP
jgi:hypothetical protein